MTAFSLTRAHERFAAFGAAALVTLFVLSGVVAIAGTQHADDALMAKSRPAVQQVEAAVQRGPRG